jgi:5'(3')-deoxyribonucleotidase
MSRGYKNVTMVAGSDRANEFKAFLDQYNNKPDKKGNIPFQFDSIDVVSSGERDPDGEGVSGISASAARAAVVAGDQAAFMKMVNAKFGGELYTELRKSMGVKEQVATNTEKLYNEVMPEQANGKPTVYLDMDGVIADFFGGVEKLYGVGHWKQLTSDKTKDLRQDVIERITGTNFFETLPKFPSADPLIAMIKKFTGGKFSILTSPLRGDHDNSAKWKKVWINQNIEQPDETIVTGRKEKYATSKGTANILVDDRPINIQKWQDKGGYGILYQANKNSLSTIEQALKNYGEKNGD